MDPFNYKYSRQTVILADGISIVLAQMLAYLFRFEFVLSANQLHNLVIGLFFIVPLKLLIFKWYGLYRGMWRYTSLLDVVDQVKATVTALIVILIAVLFVNRFQGVSRSVYIIDAVICFLFISGFRVAVKLYFKQKNLSLGLSLLALFKNLGPRSSGTPTLIIGAGDAGEYLLREIQGNHRLDINPVGFLDDSPAKKGLYIHGVPVLGKVSQVSEVSEQVGAKQIFIAIPSATYQQMRQTLKLCEETGLPFKTVPGLGEIIDGSVTVSDLRQVNYEDLLSRPPVDLDDESIIKYIRDKNVLVTGGGGSIGSGLCRQILQYQPKSLIVLDHSEFNLFQIEGELKKLMGPSRVKGYLGRVQDKKLLEMIFERENPEIVFHAAAFKHVPLVENAPWEGVFNNVWASKILMETSMQRGVKRFVLVSTDKAVRPSNVMGACKRVTELLAQSINGGDTKFIAVRFGNVVGSSGSVVPFFQEQIRTGGPVTVTHREATRYFMTIPEACKLILQAGAIGQGGEIFILQMGTPVRIMQMAEDLIRLSGKEPYKDIDIVVTGLREGEKVYEELISECEGITKTIHDKIMVLQPVDKWNGFGDQRAFQRSLEQRVEILCERAKQCDAAAVRDSLKDMVPEYQPYEGECS